MADILRLDPFQMVRGFTVPEPPQDVVYLRRWARLTVFPPDPGDVDFDANLCVGGTQRTDRATQWRLNTVNMVSGSNELLGGCENLPIAMIGRTSDARYEIPWDRKSFLGYPDCLTSQCYVRPFENSLDRWNGTSGFGTFFLTLHLGFYAQDLGFIDGEELDLELPAPPKIPIAAITRRSAFEIYVDTVSAHGQVPFGLVLLEGITSVPQYNTTFAVDEVQSPTRFSIGTSHRGDVANEGTAERFYDRL